MIRRDYILRMIEEFIQMIARLKALKNGQLWNEFSESLDDGFKRLLGDGTQAVLRLSETELLARLMHEGPTQLVREKTLMLTTLLKEAGDAAAAQDRLDESRDCYLKALHLLLGVMAESDDFECPAFVPKIEMLTVVLQGSQLPMRTYTVLMHHYERAGEFAKAEDALFAMLDAEPDNAVIAEFGLAFYQRLLNRSDHALSDGNLPRAEVEQGVRELQTRLNTLRAAKAP
jgi:pentatricopeptide repeat protein